MTHDAMEQFREALTSRNIIPPPDLVGDGKLRRCDAEGKNGRGDAAYLLHLDSAPAGGFENHRDGLGWETWTAKASRKLSPIEVAARRERIAAGKKQRDAEEARQHACAAAAAVKLLGAAEPAPADHPYLVKKKIKPNGARLYRGDRIIRGMQCHGSLLIQMRDLSRKTWNVQFIAPDGEKRFLPAGRKRGLYYGFVGTLDSGIVICEGFATAASIFEATGKSTLAAFDAGNLEPVARAVRDAHPSLPITLAGDDDYHTADNPGLMKATEAARAVGGLLAVPDFGADRPADATDANDLAAHRGAEAVRQAVANAKAPQVAEHQAVPPNAIAGDLDGPAWPEAMDEAALHGIAGEFVHMVEPNTEADPAAIHMQFLVSFGALVGRGPHYRVEGDEHHANLDLLLVGATGRGRKGTSMSRVREVFERITDWKPYVSGLSSGEGIKYHVRDAMEETTKNKHGEIVTEIADEGITDKRLLVVEAEFASVLRATQRHGNNLSATIREAWDTGNLRTLTKHDPITATGAHICIVGHITADELLAELTATDSANGFANRFLFVAVKRSKLLPFGGDGADEAEMQAFADRLHERAELARTRDRIRMTAEARTVWEKVYPALSAGGDGLHGAVTARAEAQVIRLALIYCLLDGGEHIDVLHLLAALAVWQYCDATAKHVFGASLGDRAADEIMRRLQRAGDDGLTRTDIRDVFGRNLSADRIGAALDLLRRRGRAICETVSTGSGRPTEVWRVAK